MNGTHKNFVVFRGTFAQKLIEQGFTFIGSAPDRTNPKYNVYFFQQEEGIEEALSQIIAASRS